MENNYKKKKYPEYKKDYRSDKPRRDGNPGGRDPRDRRDNARLQQSEETQFLS